MRTSLNYYYAFYKKEHLYVKRTSINNTFYFALKTVQCIGTFIKLFELVPFPKLFSKNSQSLIQNTIIISNRRRNVTIFPKDLIFYFRYIFTVCTEVIN